MSSLARARTTRVARFAAGTALLLPAVLAFGLALGYPAARTLALSLQSAALSRPGRWAGLANYLQLASNPAFRAALAHSLLAGLVRALALLLPATVAWLWTRGQRGVRLPVRLALALPLALSAPAALALLWPQAALRVPRLAGLAFTGDHPLPAYLGLEALAFLGLGGALAATALLLARPGRAWRAVLALAALLALASGLDSFTLPFTATGGGPGGATLTLPLHAFRTAFLGRQAGQAAAQASLLMALCLALGLAFGLTSERLGLRLVPAGERGTDEPPRALEHEEHEGARRARKRRRGIGWFLGPGPMALHLFTHWCNERGLLPSLRVLRGVSRLSRSRALCVLRSKRPLRRALAVAALALFLAPFLLAYLWSAGQAWYPGGQSLAAAGADLLPGLALVNGVLSPLLATLLAGLPIAYLAALSLSLVQPFGARGSRVAYLLLLAAGFVPPVVVGIGLYDGLRAVGYYDSPPAAALPFLASPAALYLLKLYFDGRAPLLEKARQAGQPVATAFFDLAFRPSLGMAALGAAVSLLLGGQSLLWPLLVLAQRDYFPLSLRLAVLQGQLTQQPAGLGAGCWLVLTSWGIAILLAWCPLQAWVARRLALTAEA